MKYWILLAAVHESDTFIPDEGDLARFVIAPETELKKYDTVYLWWHPHNRFYGWGIVAETPMDFIEEENEILKKRKRARQQVLVNRQRGFYPPITVQMCKMIDTLEK
jgi:hypothetical protein